MNKKQVWTSLALAGDNKVDCALNFFKDTQVKECLIVTLAEYSKNDGLRVRFRFDRRFETTMENSPNHLTPISVLPLAQKLYYYLLSARAGYDPRNVNEHFKIWPVEFTVKIPSLLKKTENIKGELIETSRRFVPRSTGILYKGIRPFRAQGLLTIDRCFEFHLTCLVYELKAHQLCK